MRVLSKIYYSNTRYAVMGFIENRWRERHTYEQIRGLDPSVHVLHVHALGVTALPLFDTARDYSVLLDTTWDLWRRYATAAFGISPRVASYADSVDRATYHKAKHCFTISEYAARNLQEHYGVPEEKITVVGTGRGGLSPYFGPKDYTNGSILFIAKARFEDKGGYRLIEALQIARRHNSRLSLTIVGQPEYEAEFAGIEGVTALGRVSAEQLQQLFNEASLFAMPAVFEPWGLVYLEALACQTPVLGLRHHALPEITANGRFGFCLDTGSAEEIAAALVQAFADPQRLAEMGAQGQEHCLKHFTWEKTAQRIINEVTKD
jgi:glycosyltransferase involved in cell wall biosynthesis